MLINDDTIDKTTAKYWCAFGEIDLNQMIDISKAKATSKGKSLKEMLDPMSIVSWGFMGISLIGLLTPYLKNLWKKMSSTRKNALAEVKFTADGSEYDVKFDIKKMKWVMSSGFSITDNEVQQFFQTKFFKRFNQQCQKFIEPLFKRKEEIRKSLEQVDDSDPKKFILDILKNEYKIRLNMFEAKYLT